MRHSLVDHPFFLISGILILTFELYLEAFTDARVNKSPLIVDLALNQKGWSTMLCLIIRPWSTNQGTTVCVKKMYLYQ